MITTGLALVGVAEGVIGVAVAEGIEVAVAVGAMDVAVSVKVSEGVRVGNALGKGSVGNGVEVGKSNSNKAVGVASVPEVVGKILGLGTTFEGFREGSKASGMEQRQQNATSNKPGITILPACPWRL
jgi:hypothetical protein